MLFDTSEELFHSWNKDLGFMTASRQEDSDFNSYMAVLSGHSGFLEEGVVI